MLRFLLLLVVFLLLVNIWFYGIYLLVINKKNKVISAYSQFDAELKKRYDIIPNILMAVQNVMNNERVAIEDAVRLKNEIISLGTAYENIDRRVALDSELAKNLTLIINAAESYSQLNSEQDFLSSVKEYNDVDIKILSAAKLYNKEANNLKTSIAVFPASFVARLKGIKNTDLFRF